jgi:hypothetical protein
MAKKFGWGLPTFLITTAFGLVFVALGLFFGKTVAALMALAVPATLLFIGATWINPKMVTLRRKNHKRFSQWGIFGTLGVLLIMGAIVVGTLKYQSLLIPRTPFSIHPGTTWMAGNFTNGVFWIQLNGTKKVTPIHIMAFYTITNRKSTPSLPTNLSLEMSGAGKQWYKLTNLPTRDGPIWAADISQPTNITLITLPAGFLVDKIANRALKPGEPVQGWLLCQIPATYIPSGSAERLRLTVRDSARDEFTQDLDTPTTDSSVLYTEMKFDKVSEDMRNYEVFLY